MTVGITTPPEHTRANCQAIKSMIPVDWVAERETGLRPSGDRLKGLCPLHAERTPSFVIFPDDQGFYSRWSCFGACDRSGDVIDLYAALENLEGSPVFAMEELAREFGVKLWRSGQFESEAQKANRKAWKRVHDAYLDAICRSHFRREVMPLIEAIEDEGERKEMLSDCLKAAKLERP